MSTQQLAEKTGINRSVLANLESGRRNTVSVPELLVLAEALGVPPALLIAPVHADVVEIVPGREVDPWEAVAWIGGMADRDIYLAWLHGQAVEQWQLMPERMGVPPHPRPPGMGNGALADAVASAREGYGPYLRKIRAEMRERGTRPPALPPELAHVDKADQQ